MSNLIKLRSNLTQLKYGVDQPNGGSSNQPYIQSGIPGYTSTRQQNVQYSTIANSQDTFIRGGAQGSSILRSIDKERIQKFIQDPARGPQFLQRQTQLQLMNPKMETGVRPGINPNTLLPTLIENTRTYNNDNLIEQVGLSGTGAHIVRGGDSPYSPVGIYYGATVSAQKIFNEYTTNRLVLLTQMKMKTDDGFFRNTADTITNVLGTISSGSFLDRAAPIVDFALAKRMGISLNRNFMFDYPAGPGSRIGGKDTIIPRYEDTTTIINSSTMVYETLRQQKAIQGGPITTATPNDFRRSLNGYSNSNITWDNTIPKSPTIEKRLSFGQQGNTTKGLPQGKPINYTGSIKGASDAINALLPIITKGNDSPYNDHKDMIKFGFECISNDDPTSSVALLFRATLTSGLNDTHTAAWNPFKYVGRGEDFYTYQGFSRNVSFGFRIAALTRAELKPLYNKLNYLISQVYPDYSPINSVMRAPVIKLTIGDYFNRTPGILQSVNVTVNNDYPWEINLENSDDVAQLPHVVDVTITFTPILGVLPRRSTGLKLDTTVNIPTVLGGPITLSQINNTTPLIANNQFITNATETS